MYFSDKKHSVLIEDMEVKWTLDRLTLYSGWSKEESERKIKSCFSAYPNYLHLNTINDSR